MVARYISARVGRAASDEEVSLVCCSQYVGCYKADFGNRPHDVTKEQMNNGKDPNSNSMG
jgi:hypothetical protein